MTFHRNLKTATVLFVLCLFLIWMAASPVFAIEPHEDPEAAEELFSGVSFFWYLDNVMDFLLLLDVTEVEALLGKVQFANIPLDMEPAVSDFVLSGIYLSRLLWKIDGDLSKLSTLASQFRLTESLQVAEEILISLVRSGSNFSQMGQATDVFAEVSGVSLAPIASDLSLSYEEILQNFIAIRELLVRNVESLVKIVAPLGIDLEELLGLAGTDLEELLASLGIDLEELLGMVDADLMEILASLGIDLEELLGLAGTDLEELLASLGIDLGDLLKSTEIALEIRPLAAFVGDSIHFQGVLSSGDELLGEREIDVQVNGTWHTTVRTDSQGRYEGVLSVPYRYVPEMDLRALYYPRGSDLGRYLASLSPPVKLEVLFHEAELELDVADKAYPGRETTVAGRFDYGDTAPQVERDIEVYLDDVLVIEVAAQSPFSQRIELPAGTETGQHLLTVSASGKGRYAPVVASTTLNVVRATPVLDIALPGVIVIPGSVGLLGTLRSEVGPLSGALLTFELDRSRVEAVSTAVGDFDARLSMAMNLALVGSQDMRINIIPQEPWHAPLQIVRQVLIINVVNVGVLVVLLVVMGVYLPGRLKGRFGAFVRRVPSPVIRSPRPVSTPSYSTEVKAIVPVAEEDESGQAPESRILGWYRIVTRLLQRMTQVLLKPQQTLREFASECGGALGPAAGYFTELTRIVEKVLYSRHRPTQEDAERSRHLSNTIEGVLRDEDS